MSGFMLIYRAHREAAAAAYGVAGNDPLMSGKFAGELVDSWIALAQQADNQLTTTDALGKREGNSYSYDAAGGFSGAKDRLLLEGRSLVGAYDFLGLESTIPADDSARLWRLVFDVASTADIVADAPSNWQTDGEILLGTVTDTAKTIAGGSLDVLGAVGKALEGPLALVVAGIGLLLLWRFHAA